MATFYKVEVCLEYCLKIVKHRLHVLSTICVRRGPERRESGPRQDSLPFIAAINRRYDYHTQYVDIFTKWAARFRVKYQNRPPPSTSYYCSRLSNVLILQTCIMYGNCSVCRVARCPGVLPVLYISIYLLSTYIYIYIAHFNQVYILLSFAKLGTGRSRNICRYAGAWARATVVGYVWYQQCRYWVDTV